MARTFHVLVLSISAGAGHVRAAQALCAQAQLSHPQLQLTHLDVMDLVPGAFKKLYGEPERRETPLIAPITRDPCEK